MDEADPRHFLSVMRAPLFYLFGDTIRKPIGRLHFAGSETYEPAQHCAGYLDGELEAGMRISVISPALRTAQEVMTVISP